MGVSASGAQDSNSFRQKMQGNHIDSPNFDDLTYNGLLNEYYFNFGEKNDTEILTAFTASAFSMDPLTNQRDQYLSIGLTSKYDGDGVKKFGRPSCKIVIVLDISGSMGTSFCEENIEVQKQKSKLEIAKTVLKSMLPQINSKDYYALIAFDTEADIVFPLTLFSEVDKDFLELKISNLQTRGGTNFEKGFRAAYDILQKEPAGNEYEKRIFYLTDACPNQGDTSPGSLLHMNLEASSKGIYTTYFGVGLDFNTQLIETICKAKACSYYTIMNEVDFKKLLIEDFDYMVYPFAYEIMIKTDAKIKNVYGSNDTDPDQEGRLAYIQSFMPSNIGDQGVKGGMILLKLKENTKEVNVKITFVDRDGQKMSNEIKVTVPDTQEDNFYQNTAIRKAILLTRYVAILKDLYKTQENQNTELGGSNDKKMEIDDLRRQQLLSFKDNYFIKEVAILNDPKLKQESDILVKLIDKDKPKEVLLEQEQVKQQI